MKVFLGITTAEFFRSKRHYASGPWSQGAMKNLKAMCCVMPPRQVHIAHQPLETKANEIELNKNKIVFLSAEEALDHSLAYMREHTPEPSPSPQPPF